MKKLCLTMIFAIVIFATVNAQLRIGVSESTAMPLFTFADGANLGIGGAIHLDYSQSGSGAMGLKVGYIGFGKKDIVSTTIIPITFTYNSFLGKGKIFKPYYDGELGLGIISSKIDKTTLTKETTTSASKFAWKIGIGMEYLLNQKLTLDPNLGYYNILTDGGGISYLGLNLGVKYNLSK